MTEAEIVASLQAKVKPMDQPAPIVEQVVQEAEQPLKLDTNQNTDLPAMKLFDFFDIDQAAQRDRTTLDKLNKMYEWVSGRIKSDDSSDIMLHLRQLEGMLGLTFRTGEKFETLYRYLKLDNERRSIEKEIQLV